MVWLGKDLDGLGEHSKNKSGGLILTVLARILWLMNFSTIGTYQLSFVPIRRAKDAANKGTATVSLLFVLQPDADAVSHHGCE